MNQKLNGHATQLAYAAGAVAAALILGQWLGPIVFQAGQRNTGLDAKIAVLEERISRVEKEGSADFQRHVGEYNVLQRKVRDVSEDVARIAEFMDWQTRALYTLSRELKVELEPPPSAAQRRRTREYR